MRVRKKKHEGDRLNAVSEYMINNIDSINTSGILHIEVGCGKGSFITQLAERNPHINFIGIERVPSVILLAAEKAAKKELKNVKFILGNVMMLENIEKENLCERIYLNFSDPWPRKRHAKRRLTAPGFLKLYKKILVQNGEIHLKTDNRNLFEFSLDMFEQEGFKTQNTTYDLHANPPKDNIETEYEQNFVAQGMPIHRTEAILSEK